MVHHLESSSARGLRKEEADLTSRNRIEGLDRRPGRGDIFGERGVVWLGEGKRDGRRQQQPYFRSPESLAECGEE
jgi:hypothetical protein